jgi:hypothetical protein
MESVEHIFIILFQPCYNFDFNESWFLNNFRVKSSDFISGEKIQNYLQLAALQARPTTCPPECSLVIA